VIAARHLAIGHSRATLLEQVSFTLPAGECWAVVGRNGSGKTTLLATLAGLLPSHAGEIHLLSRPLRDWSRSAVARHLGFLPQYQPTVFPYTVREFVDLGRMPWRRRLSAGLAIPDNAIETSIATLGLGDLRARPVNALSGGEAQRVCVAQLLAQSTDVLLLDEPLSHLDLLHQVTVMELLRSLAYRGHAVAIAIHDLLLAWRFCDRLLVLGPAPAPHGANRARLIAARDHVALADALSWAFEVDFQVDANGPRPAVPISERYERNQGSV